MTTTQGPNWTVVSQREGVIELANGTFTDGVIITIAAGPDQVELTTGVRNSLYSDTALVQSRLQTLYNQWAAVQGLSG